VASVAITVEGVVRQFFGGQPIPQGLDLYYGLATRMKVVLITDEMDRLPDDLRVTELAYWLRLEGMTEHQRIVYTEPHWTELGNAARRVAQVNEARRMGHDISLVIEPDPAVSAELINSGYNVLTFTHAAYSVPSWRPDYKHTPVPWDKLSVQVEREAFLRANDERRTDDARS
jgi:hypothetical protein